MTANEVKIVVDDRVATLLAAAREMMADPAKPLVEQSIGWALRALGYPTASLLGPTDVEVTAAAAQVDALLDLSEMRLLETLQTNLLTRVTLETGPVTEELGETLEQLAKLVPLKRKAAALMHGKWLEILLDDEVMRRKVKLATL